MHAAMQSASMRNAAVARGAASAERDIAAQVFPAFCVPWRRQVFGAFSVHHIAAWDRSKASFTASGAGQS